MKKYVTSARNILHGGDYNPEQWRDTPEVWEEDMRLMRLAGINEATVGVFSWAVLEPEEGKFDFSFLDTVLDKIAANGGKVILATPSGARPRWLAEKYPEVLRTEKNREKNIFGERHNHCLTSPIYREKVRIMDEALAKRYAHHPAVIAWHLSNELNGECHCALCQRAFRQWLQNKYGTLEKLNFTWWTSFWSHNYTSWEQIESPSPRGDMGVHGLNLDWYRFCTDQTISFIETEKQAVQQYNPDIPVTTNLMRGYFGLNYYKIAEHLDFVSWDSYPDWGAPWGNYHEASSIAFDHDTFRSMKKQPFFLMESTPSLVNWKSFNKLKRPGQNALVSLQAVAHGSDSVQYFQWRKGRGSSEKFHGAVVDHYGKEDTRVFREVAALGKTLACLDEIVGTMPEAKVAMIYDYENNFALADAQAFARHDKKYYLTENLIYKHLFERNVAVDVLPREADLSDYAVVIAPMLYLCSQTTIDRFTDFVANGGTLLATYMLGMTDENDLCHLGGFPGGKLKEVFGIWNEEIDSLYPEERVSVSYGGKTYEAMDYCERIHAQGAEVLATYASEFYAGEPAVTCNAYGKGKAYYVACRDTGELMDALIGRILAEKHIVGYAPKTENVSVSMRTDGENEYYFCENHGDTATACSLVGSFTDMETGERVINEVSLPPLTCRILKKDAS